MRVVKRILLGILILILALAVFLAASVAVDRLVDGRRLEPLTNTSLPGPEGVELRAFVARPSTPGPHPAVIMIHEFWGLKPDIVGKAEALAQEGYVVVAPNLFGRHTTNWIPSAIYNVIATPQEQILGDLDAVFAWLESQDDMDIQRVGIMGFCFGGGSSLRYSLHNNHLAATVVLYGSPVTDVEQLRSLPGPLLGIFGGADQSIPVEEVRAFESALNDAGVPNTISIYEGQPHAFVHSIEEIRRGGAQGQAWQQVLDFFKANLQETASARREVQSSQALSPIPWQYAAMLAYEHAFGMHRPH